MPWISLSQLKIISCAGLAVYSFLISLPAPAAKFVILCQRWISISVNQSCESEQFGIGFVMMLKRTIGQVE